MKYLNQILCLILIQTGCLERVRGVPEPLDDRFFKDVGSHQFSALEQDSISISGTIQSEISISIDLDLRTPDVSVEGGMKSLDKFIIKQPGDFSIQIPKNIGAIELQVFQDMLGDGPSKEDHFAQMTLEVGDKDIENLEIQLIKGARNQNSSRNLQTNDMQTEEPYFSDRPNGGRPGQQVDTPFENYGGKTIQVSGIILCEQCTIVDLDIFEPNAGLAGGRNMLGKIKVVGAKKKFSFDVPYRFGQIILEAFVDTDGDGPSAGDLMGAYSQNPLHIGDDDIEGVNIKLYVSEDGQIPKNIGKE